MRVSLSFWLDQRKLKRIRKRMSLSSLAGRPEMLSADLINGAAAAAAYTGLPQRTIYHLVETGQLPAIRKGRRLYFRKTELEQSFSSAA